MYDRMLAVHLSDRTINPHSLLNQLISVQLHCKSLLFFFILLLAGVTARAQAWSGKIVDNDNKAPLQSVVVTNTNNKMFVFTDENGDFSIDAATGDKISFSCPGYKSETHTVIQGTGGIRLTFGMKLYGTELNEVVFKRRFADKYQNDSADRRSTYKKVLDYQRAGIGSPVSFVADRLSRKSRDLYNFKKMYNTMEDQRYIDTKYTPELVQSLTQLKGDTLAKFMNSYPMPVEYARNATDLELKMWIRSNFKNFMQRTDSLKLLDK